MTILLYFILGIIFYGLVMPILESFSSLIITIIEYFKGKITLKLQKAAKENGCDEATYAIGFDTSSGITLEEDDWEDDE